ncbi:FkbM family methyltransferase [Methylobacterium sp.]|uniref:FkbM family methyltransferase n=1 Tax=Methylobacterium sp. TaxID=409 RepID=UPI000F9F4A24|nr:FkbM family methyltransferase [Methylobacterium sp.]RUP16992.1 MAG: hypothetical protein EKK44_31395 [Methylobacterium sp.]
MKRDVDWLAFLPHAVGNRYVRSVRRLSETTMIRQKIQSHARDYIRRRSPALSHVAVQNRIIDYLVVNEAAFVQCGANGVAEDDLQTRAVKSGVRCILIEPHPFYVDVLSERYAKASNVTVVPRAASSRITEASLYYVDPEMADEMDGAGPANRWAHGQGSFSLESVKYWIEQNEFRWRSPEKTRRYIDGIRSIRVACAPLPAIIAEHGIRSGYAAVIDVQGAENVVIRGMFKGQVRPGLVLYEDDRGLKLFNFLALRTRGYHCASLGSDVLFLK